MRGRLADLVRERFGLIVSLIRNEPDYARAAEEAGADAVKVHLNVDHRASGIRFGSLAEERDRIQSILNAVKIPVGVMPGTAALFPALEKIREMEEMGIDFLDFYHRDAPGWLLDGGAGISLMPAVSEDDDPGLTDTLNKCGFDLVELSFISRSEYGKTLNADDVSRYEGFCKTLEAPCIVPTQKKILPGQVGELKIAGVAGLMVGAVVTGTDVNETRQAIRAFREAIDLG